MGTLQCLLFAYIQRSCLAFVSYSCSKLTPQLILLIPYISITTGRINHLIHIIGSQTVHNFNNTGFVRINISLRPFRVTFVSVASNKNYIYEFVFVALVIQHTERTRRVTSSSEDCLAVPYFSMLSHIRHNVGKKLLNIKCL
jgi:hypothetical protein